MAIDPMWQEIHRAARAAGLTWSQWWLATLSPYYIPAVWQVADFRDPAGRRLLAMLMGRN